MHARAREHSILHGTHPILSTAICLLLAAPAMGEGFLDLRMGSALTHSGEVDVEDEIDGFTVTADTPSDESLELGLRVGHWFLPFLGFGIDFSHFEADGGPVGHNDVYPLTPLLMFRVPIIDSPAVPGGILQPYAGIGPGFFFTDSSVDLRPAASRRVSRSSLEVGLDARAGLAWQFHPNLAVFGEYRFTHFQQRLDEDDEFIDIFGGPDVTAERDISTHHLLFGISFRF